MMATLKLMLWVQLVLAVFCTFQNGRRYKYDREGGLQEERRRATHSAENIGRPCGEGFCRCQSGAANCSRVPGGLQYLPQLPPNTLYLYFSYNQLKTVPENFFYNVTRLLKVDISHNNLTFISSHAFHSLSRLKSLYLSSNPGLNYTTLSPAFFVSSLQVLDIMSCSLGPLPQDLFHNATLPSLTSLRLHDNDVGNVQLSVFKPLKALRELGLATNIIIRVNVTDVLGLEKINLDSNDLFEFPTTCDENGSSFFPRLKILLLQGNRLSNIPDPVCLPKLQVIALGKNAFSTIASNTFAPKRFPSLTQVSFFSMSTLIKGIEKKAFNNPTLQRIDLAYTHIKFSSFDDDSFVGCPRLYNLELGHNIMDVNEEKFVKLFGHLSSVSLVDMQDCRLRYLSPRMLAGFHNLSRLHLNRNLLPTLSDHLFDKLVNLRQLDLSQNQIRVVQPAAFSAAIRDRLHSLDLSGNVFSCSCDVLWFQNWLISNASLFKNSWMTYNCSNIPGMLVQWFHLDPQACLLSHTTYILIAVLVSTVILTLTLIFSLVRYRWHLRLLLYEAFRAGGNFRRRHLLNNYFDYDVFVTYDSFDGPWVRQHLVLELEERLGLRLCLPDRDLEANLPELESISNGVEKSKKIMMLFSNNFVQNHLCQFQLSMCLRHALDHGDALIIVCLDDLAARDMTTGMLGVLKTTSYIQWADDHDAVTSFWGRLRIALQEVIQEGNP